MRQAGRLWREAQPRHGLAVLGDDRLRETLACATDYAIMTFDAKARITSWNAGARRLFGWDELEAQGRSVSFVLTLEDRMAGSPEREMQRATDDGQVADERWHMRRDGSRFWGRGQVMRLRGPGEAGFLKILRDHTVQHRAEMALRESEARWQMLQDAAGVGTWDWDLATGEMRLCGRPQKHKRQLG